jgi:hypothetical protein
MWNFLRGTVVIHRITHSIHLLNYSIEQSPSWEAKPFVAGQEIPRILWNQKSNFRIYKRPPPVPILSHPNPAQSYIVQIMYIALAWILYPLNFSLLPLI